MLLLACLCLLSTIFKRTPPNTDLRMSCADACSLGRLPSLDWYWTIYASKIRGSGTHVGLLKQYIVTSGRAPRYLRVDGAKKIFNPEEMMDLCRDNNIILQVSVAYNHTMQARIEGAIGCSKQHSRVAIVCADMPTRFWSDAILDFTCKKITL